MASPVLIDLVRFSVDESCRFQNLCLKLHYPGEALSFGMLLDGDIDFCGRGVLLIPEPSFLLGQKPSLGWIVDGLLL